MKGLLMDTINPPMVPEELDPVPHPPIAGDFKDDDGPAIDEWFENPPSGPQEYGTIPVKTEPAIKPVTRIVSRVIRMTCSATVNSDPILLLNADPNREDLIIRVNTTVTQIPRPDKFQFMIGSDKADLYNGADFGGLCTTVSFGIEWRSDKHTGPVWILCRQSPDDAAPTTGVFDVVVWSVTR
jgi:hypothetical protein